MKYKTTTQNYLFFLTSIIFIVNIKLSFAKAPSYECFMLANDSQYKKYKVTLPLSKTVHVENHRGASISSSTGWLMPYYAPFRFSIIDKSDEKRTISIGVKGQPKTITLKGPKFDCHAGLCFSQWAIDEKFYSGYFITAQDVSGKRLHISGCGNASSFRKVYARVGTTDEKGRVYKGHVRCCILNITS